MHIGLVGLGKMGGNMRDAAARAPGIEVTGYAPRPGDHRRRDARRPGRGAARARIGVGDGARRRHHPARPSTSSASCSPTGDLVIDGGNSHFTDDRSTPPRSPRRASRYVDCGVSGGVWGVDRGLRPDGRRRRRGRRARDAGLRRAAARGAARGGLLHAGPVGAGHYAKMVHNGIEYAIMQAFAEGYELLERQRRRHRRARRSSRAGAAAPWSGPGCSTCSSPRSTRTPAWSRSAATPTTPARAAGRSRRRIANAVPDADHRRVAVRPVRLPAGGLARR